MTRTLSEIFSYCQQQQLNLTSQQEVILGTLFAHDHAITANEILLNLRQQNPKANRMTIHRALEYLSKIGLIHKIAYNHTYTLCNHFANHNCQILVCQACGTQIELHSSEVQQALHVASASYGFKISSPVEITGYCKRCQPTNI